MKKICLSLIFSLLAITSPVLTSSAAGYEPVYGKEWLRLTLIPVDSHFVEHAVYTDITKINPLNQFAYEEQIVEQFGATITMDMLVKKFAAAGLIERLVEVPKSTELAALPSRVFEPHAYRRNQITEFIVPKQSIPETAELKQPTSESTPAPPSENEPGEPNEPEVPNKPETPNKPEVPEQKPTEPNPPSEKPSLESGPISNFEKEVISLTNKERQKNGLSPLSADTKLSDVARLKSKDMRSHGYFDHTSPTYGSPFDMMQQFGISFSKAAENIAYGQQTPEEVVRAWMNSSGHRANILNPDFSHIGVGFESNGHYWTQMFILK